MRTGPGGRGAGWPREELACDLKPGFRPICGGTLERKGCADEGCGETDVQAAVSGGASVTREHVV